MDYTTSSTTFQKPEYDVKIINISESKMRRKTEHPQDDECYKRNEKNYLQYMRTIYYINHLITNIRGASKLYSDVHIDLNSIQNSKYTVLDVCKNTKDNKKYVNLRNKNLINDSLNNKNVYDHNLLDYNKNLKRTETFNLIIAPCRNRSARIVLNKFGKLNGHTKDKNIFPKRLDLPPELKNSNFIRKNIENNIEKDKKCSKCYCPILPVHHQDIPKKILQKSRQLRKPPKFKSEETQTSPRVYNHGDHNDLIVNVVASKSEDSVCIGFKTDNKDEEVYIRCQPNEDVNVQNCLNYLRNEKSRKTYGKKEKYLRKDEENLSLKEIFNSNNMFKKYKKF